MDPAAPAVEMEALDAWRHRPPLLAAPDLAPWRAGNALPGVWSFESARPGPHAAILALTHGNEIAGAVLLDRWLRAGLRPLRGRLSLAFANLDAFSRFDPADPTVARFVEEDLNRLWAPGVLDGPRRSVELRRARALRPLLDSVDLLLDLHSMFWPGDPLLVSGGAEPALDLALRLGEPALVVSDPGHAEGTRLIDHAPLAARGGAVLLEAGWHWEEATVARMDRVARRFLALAGVLPAPVPPPAAPPVLARVTHCLVPRGPRFRFARPFRSGEVVAAGTLLATEDEVQHRAPHPRTLLVMPNLLPQPGQTALRLALPG
ncbi:succinylglutamate desuccinylase/aspartoacylase family protein [Roseococcus sp. DSY-14]|uniref:succinylglutamate desuccinylase/aspartoacylase domain-containing protein n=1 Tax=Roseococcus sp. DSY-14 TaxID=3369650 RepID=UPI00387B9110